LFIAEDRFSPGEFVTVTRALSSRIVVHVKR
jgi:hypothetical protein